MAALCELENILNIPQGSRNSKNYFFDHAEDYCFYFGDFPYGDGQGMRYTFGNPTRLFLTTIESKNKLEEITTSGYDSKTKEHYKTKKMYGLHELYETFGSQYLFEDYGISHYDNKTLTFGSLGAYKTIFECEGCHEWFYIANNPSDEDIRSIKSFDLEKHVPISLDLEIIRDRSSLTLTIEDRQTGSKNIYKRNDKTGSYSVNEQALSFREFIRVLPKLATAIDESLKRPMGSNDS